MWRIVRTSYSCGSSVFVTMAAATPANKLLPFFFFFPAVFSTTMTVLNISNLVRGEGVTFIKIKNSY